VRLIILSDLEETLRHPVVHFEDGGFRFMALREEPLENPLNRFVKRAIDIVVSALILIVVFPVVATIIWIAQRLQSPRPALPQASARRNSKSSIHHLQISHDASGRELNDRVVFEPAEWKRGTCSQVEIRVAAVH
jgi:hypothetical protein